MLTHLFDKLSLRQAVTLFVAVAMVCTLALAGIAQWHARASEHISNALHGQVKQARAAGLLDMMHDALRGDTQAARLLGAEGDGADKQALIASVNENVKTMAAALAEVMHPSSPAAVREAAQAAAPVTEAYAQKAQAIVAAALAGSEKAADQIKAFEAAFEKLEKRASFGSGLNRWLRVPAGWLKATKTCPRAPKNRPAACNRPVPRCS